MNSFLSKIAALRAFHTWLIEAIKAIYLAFWTIDKPCLSRLNHLMALLTVVKLLWMLSQLFLLFQTLMVSGQEKNKCRLDSGSILQREQTGSTSKKDRRFIVARCPLSSCQAENENFGGIKLFQIALCQNFFSPFNRNHSYALADPLLVNHEPNKAEAAGSYCLLLPEFCL